MACAAGKMIYGFVLITMDIGEKRYFTNPLTMIETDCWFWISQSL
jgi:hypothetical protein